MEQCILCAQSVDKGRRKSSVSLMCILGFLKNNRAIFVSTKYYGGAGRKTWGYMKKLPFFHLGGSACKAMVT